MQAKPLRIAVSAVPVLLGAWIVRQALLFLVAEWENAGVSMNSALTHFLPFFTMALVGTGFILLGFLLVKNWAKAE